MGLGGAWGQKGEFVLLMLTWLGWESPRLSCVVRRPVLLLIRYLRTAKVPTPWSSSLTQSFGSSLVAVLQSPERSNPPTRPGCEGKPYPVPEMHHPSPQIQPFLWKIWPKPWFLEVGVFGPILWKENVMACFRETSILLDNLIEALFSKYWQILHAPQIGPFWKFDAQWSRIEGNKEIFRDLG